MSRNLTMTDAQLAAHYAKHGFAYEPAQAIAPSRARKPRPPLPSLQAQYPESGFYAVLQTVGHQHGWLAECSWMPHGEDQGLCCWLVRPPELLYALIRRPGQALTPGQRRWLMALRKTSVEVVEWSSADVKGMTERLSRKVQTGMRASRPSLESPSTRKGHINGHDTE